jgi:hypothetical protein
LIKEAKDRSKFLIAGDAEATVAATASAVSKAKASPKKGASKSSEAVRLVARVSGKDSKRRFTVTSKLVRRGVSVDALRRGWCGRPVEVFD